jgi:2-amino-4-hydroxy-6-hydroxymethyldihydropteridine diphosphokinase
MPLPPDARPVRAYIGLGGNLDQPVDRIRLARRAISDLEGVREAGFSSLYRSVPMGPADQPDYVNAVMAVDTVLEPLSLLDQLQAIEAANGRVRLGERWGPRTLDLDILLFGDAIIDMERLRVPHPGLCEREFVLVPLQEIATGLEIPGRGWLRDWISACPRRGLDVIADD